MIRDKVLHNDFDTFDFALTSGRRVHFIGVGGVSMSQLAIYTLGYASYVSGSDMVYGERLDTLSVNGVDVYVGSSTEKVLSSDIVVYSSAIGDDDVELMTARTNGKIMVERCEYLASISRTMGVTIAVSGTHGKSTTTALIESIFSEANKAITAHIGASTIKAHSATGKDYFIVEACEYNRSFLHLRPDYAVVLGIDYDHPDCYADIDDMRGAFDEFMDSALCVIASDSIARDGAITYGEYEADYTISNVAEREGNYTFDIVHNGVATSVTSPLPGRYNIYNITAAYAVAYEVGIAEADIVRGIERFGGLRRRYEVLGNTTHGANVVTDYAHHPREIASVIRSAHERTRGRVIVAFEPHTYSRTASLIDEFVECFYWADSLILLPTYGAREVESDGMTSLDLADRLASVGDPPLYYDSYEKAVRYIESVAMDNDTILVLGAGSIYKLGDMLVNNTL